MHVRSTPKSSRKFTLGAAAWRVSLRSQGATHWMMCRLWVIARTNFAGGDSYPPPCSDYNTNSVAGSIRCMWLRFA